MVKKHAKDIPTIHRLRDELIQKIRTEVKTGKTKTEVAKEMKLPYSTVIQHTRDIPVKSKIPKEKIEKIRKKVKNGIPKIEVAKYMKLPYSTVIRHTRDILLQPKAPKISNEKIEEIRRRVKNGKTKTEVAKEMHISISAVSRHTGDINPVPKKADISYRAFLMLQNLIDKGYAFPCPQYGTKEYQELKKKFPRIWRVKMYGRTIFYFEDKSDIAMKMFLENINKKILSHQELQPIIDVFKVNISTKDKVKYIKKKD